MSKMAWKTTHTKDGKQTLSRPFYCTNPAYIEVHREWAWEEVGYDLAVAEMMSHQLAHETPESKPKQ